MPALVRTKYESDSGQIHAIRLSPAVAQAAGNIPADAVNSNIRVKVSKGNREYGIRPRGVIIGLTVGVPPDTFVRTAFIPVLNSTQFNNGTAYALGASVAYKNNADWEVLSRVREDY
jgi:hypothetical protein